MNEIQPEFIIDMTTEGVSSARNGSGLSMSSTRVIPFWGVLGGSVSFNQKLATTKFIAMKAAVQAHGRK